MTVAELIAKLQQMPQDARVARWESEGMAYLVDVQPPKILRVSLDPDGDYHEVWQTKRSDDIDVVAIW